MKPSGQWAEFRIFELGGGVTLFVQPTERFKNVTMRLFLRGHLGDGPSETALLPTVLTRGTRRRPTMARIATHLEGLYGAHADADAFKVGESHVVSFRVDVVADRHLPAGSKNVRKGLEYLSEMAREPALEKKTLRKDYVSQERHNQVRALEDLMSDRGEFAGQRCLEEMCRGEAYAIHELGSLAGLKAVTPASLTRRWKDLVDHAPAEVYVAGRVNPSDIADACAKLFGRKQGTKTATIPETVVNVPVGEIRRITETMDVEQGKLVMGFRTWTTYADRLSTALSFFNGIFGGFAHSRLFVNVREREGLAYSAGSSIEKNKGILMVHAGIDPDKYERCLAVIEEEIASIRAGKISDQEMESTRKAMSERARGVLDSPGRAISSLYERRLAGKVQTVEEVLADIASATKEDVVEVANRVRLDTVYWLTKKANREPAKSASARK